MRADADDDQPFGFLDAVRILLRITQLRDVDVLGSLDLLGRAMGDEDRLRRARRRSDADRPGLERDRRRWSTAPMCRAPGSGYRRMARSSRRHRRRRSLRRSEAGSRAAFHRDALRYRCAARRQPFKNLVPRPVQTASEAILLMRANYVTDCRRIRRPTQYRGCRYGARGPRPAQTWRSFAPRVVRAGHTAEYRRSHASCGLSRCRGRSDRALRLSPRRPSS